MAKAEVSRVSARDPMPFNPKRLRSGDPGFQALGLISCETQVFGLWGCRFRTEATQQLLQGDLRPSQFASFAWTKSKGGTQDVCNRNY